MLLSIFKMRVCRGCVAARAGGLWARCSRCPRGQVTVAGHSQMWVVCYQRGTRGSERPAWATEQVVSPGPAGTTPLAPVVVTLRLNYAATTGQGQRCRGGLRPRQMSLSLLPTGLGITDSLRGQTVSMATTHLHCWSPRAAILN